MLSQLVRRVAFLAQMVERWPFKPMVVGSIPTEGAFFIFPNARANQLDCDILWYACGWVSSFTSTYCGGDFAKF